MPDENFRENVFNSIIGSANRCNSPRETIDTERNLIKFPPSQPSTHPPNLSHKSSAIYKADTKARKNKISNLQLVGENYPVYTYTHSSIRI